MKSHEIFQKMSATLATELFTFLQTDDRDVYKAAIQGLVNQRKLRSVFIERKPPNERYAWMQAALSRPASDAMASHILQAWLLAAHRQMLCDFLAALEIPHADDGTAEVIPPSPAKEKIVAAAAELLTKYPAEAVTVYLHAFQGMEGSEEWAPLGEILHEDERFQFARRNESIPEKE